MSIKIEKKAILNNIEIVGKTVDSLQNMSDDEANEFVNKLFEEKTINITKDEMNRYFNVSEVGKILSGNSYTKLKMPMNERIREFLIKKYIERNGIIT